MPVISPKVSGRYFSGGREGKNGVREICAPRTFSRAHVLGSELVPAVTLRSRIEGSVAKAATRPNLFSHERCASTSAFAGDAPAAAGPHAPSVRSLDPTVARQI